MKRHSSGFYIGVVIAIILGFGIIAGVWAGLHAIAGLGNEPDVLRAAKTGPDSATLNLSTFPDSNVCHPGVGDPESGWVTYCSGDGKGDPLNGTNFEVPANSTITVIIKQYDSSTPLHNDYFNTVRGTIGGDMVVNNKHMTRLDSGNVAHTFTLQSTPDSSFPIFVSVPLMGTDSNAPTNVQVAGNPYQTPNTIMFQFRTGPPGSYVWHCYDPCGSGLQGDNEGFGGPMSTTGYMAGTLTVTSY